MLSSAAATPWEGMLMLQPGFCVFVALYEVLKSDLVKDSTEAQTTEDSDCLTHLSAVLFLAAKPKETRAW